MMKRFVAPIHVILLACCESRCATRGYMAMRIATLSILNSMREIAPGTSATFLRPKRVQDTPERSVVPASQPVAMARGPLDQPPRFGLTLAPQALLRHRS